MCMTEPHLAPRNDLAFGGALQQWINPLDQALSGAVDETTPGDEGQPEEREASAAAEQDS